MPIQLSGMIGTLGKRRAGARPIARWVLSVPVLLSLAVHAALVGALVTWQWERARGPERVSEAGGSTMLELAERAAPERAVVPAAPVVMPLAPPPMAREEEKVEREKAPAAREALVVTPVAPAPEVKTKPAPASADVPVRREATPVERPAEPLPAPSAEEAGPVSFAGVESRRAARVVYVIDGSGVMASSLPFVKEELVRSVAKLGAGQSFQVIASRVGKVGSAGTEYFRGATLVSAGGKEKQELARWLATVEPGGRSDPLAGLSAALALKPDLVLLLTRSIRRSGKGAEWGAGNAATLAELERLNPVDAGTGRRGAVIKAVQFVEEDPTGLLRAIAEAHGDGEGSYRVVPVE